MILNDFLYVMYAFILPCIDCAEELGHILKQKLNLGSEPMSESDSSEESSDDSIITTVTENEDLKLNFSNEIDKYGNLVEEFFDLVLYRSEKTIVMKKYMEHFDYIFKLCLYDETSETSEGLMIMDFEHKNIVKGYSEVEIPEIGVYFVIIENLPIKLDSEHFVNNKVKTVLNIAIDVTNALIYLHSSKIIHNDISLDNVMGAYENGQIIYKLIDFGKSTVTVKIIILEKYFGSKLYMAPETKFEKRLSCKTDIWQVGMLIYRIITDSYNTSFDGLVNEIDVNSPEEYVYNIKEKYKGCELELLLDKVLVLDPNERPDANELLLLLNEELKNHLSRINE